MSVSIDDGEKPMVGPGMNQFRKQFNKGEILIQEGEIGDELFLLEKGVLDILVQGRKLNTIDSRNTQDFVGEIGAILGTPRTATVVAVTDCIVFCFPKIKLEQAISNAPSLGMKLVRSLCEKLHSSLMVLTAFSITPSSIINSGDLQLSLRNYMKGLLFLLDAAAQDDTGEQSRYVRNYFLQTNPWGIQHGNEGFLLETASPNRADSR